MITTVTIIGTTAIMLDTNMQIDERANLAPMVWTVVAQKDFLLQA
jgi:hypothetical protein